MRSWKQHLFRRVVIFTMLATISSGCTSPQQALPSRADLTARKAIVRLIRPGTTDELLIDEQTHVEIRQNDQIEVDEHGRAFLHFPEDIVVELFHNTGMLVMSDPRLDSTGAALVQLKLMHGMAKIDLPETTNGRVQVETDYAVLRVTDPGTIFATCHAPELTCVTALSGELEIEAQGEVVTLEGGEGSYILANQPPSPPSCADVQQVDNFLDVARGTGPAGTDLGAIVAGWPQPPCSTPGASTSNQIEPATPTTALCQGEYLADPKDGSAYVHVPSGEFVMGADAAPEVSSLEQPQHTVSVGDFWIQCTEVTNARYARCVDAGACTPPADATWKEAERANYPVTHVTWQQANDYARWVGGRLPSEAEWEKACRGADGRKYPWGNEPPTAELANFGDTVGEATPVGNYPAGASPYGVLDMSGNVWEWTSSLDTAYPYRANDGREDPNAAGKRIARGGSFYYTQYQATCTSRSGFSPSSANEYFGFRVVRSP